MVTGVIVTQSYCKYWCVDVDPETDVCRGLDNSAFATYDGVCLVTNAVYAMCESWRKPVISTDQAS